MLRKNEIYRTTVKDINNLGFGVAKIEGITVFIGGAVDGDEIDARIILVNKTYAVARIEKIRSEERRVGKECNRLC